MFPFFLISTSLPVNMHIFQWIYRVSPQIEAKQRCGEGVGRGGGGGGGGGGGVQGMFWMSPMVQKEKASNILH